MKKISEMEGRPLSAESRKKLETVVRDAYSIMAARLTPTVTPEHP
jgi:hypothetical protein